MNELDEKKQGQAIVLFAMLSVAIILTAVAVGLFFGAQWSFALLAVCATVSFVRALHSIRKENREKDGE